MSEETMQEVCELLKDMKPGTTQFYTQPDHAANSCVSAPAPAWSQQRCDLLAVAEFPHCLFFKGQERLLVEAQNWVQ